jgi:polygalacturonase
MLAQLSSRNFPMPPQRRILAIGPILLLAMASGLEAFPDVDPDEQIKQGVAHILATIKEPEIPARSIQLIEFAGHAPDTEGSHDFHKAIAGAVDELASAGGGSLNFGYPAGARGIVTYRLRGPIELKSNTALRLDRGIRIFFEFDPASYRPGGKGVLTSYEGTTLYTHSPLIRTFNAENIAIIANPGEGPLPVLDGDGQRWRDWEVDGNRKRGSDQDAPEASYQRVKEINNSGIPIRERRLDEEFLRPPLVQLFLSRRVLMENVKLVNSPFWTVHPRFSENLVFRGLEFEALVANNDGIDPDSSRYVLIENIKFHNADDNIAVKAGRDLEGREGVDIAGTELEGLKSHYIRNGRIYGPSEHILIRNNRFRGHYAICIGSEMSGGVHHLYALNNEAEHPVRMGFYIKGGRNRGGTVSHIYVRDLKLGEVIKEAIRLVPNYDNDLKSPYPSKFHDIYLDRMSVKKAGLGVRIFGWHDQPIFNVLLRDVTVENVAASADFEYENVRDVVLKNVMINGRSNEGAFSRMHPEVVPPK